jgi:hypothetical protein
VEGGVLIMLSRGNTVLKSVLKFVNHVMYFYCTNWRGKKCFIYSGSVGVVSKNN